MGNKCCMCFETKGVHKLKDCITQDNEGYVKIQANILIEMGQDKESGYCQECFWK